MKNQKLKVAILNTTDIGGAAVATLALRDAVQSLVDADLILSYRIKNTESEVFRSSFFTRFRIFFGTTLPKKIFNRDTLPVWHDAKFPSFLHKKLNRRKYDIIHLNWVNANFLSLKDIQHLDAPIVWTMHDSWPFTSGCHIPNQCEAFKNNCFNCPIVKPFFNKTIIRKNRNAKKRLYSKKKITFTVPSSWLQKQALESSLLCDQDVRVIPNSVDTVAFKPINIKKARLSLGLPLDKKIILFGGSRVKNDPFKGFDLFIDSYKKLGNKDDYFVCFFGDDPHPDDNQFANYKNFGSIYEKEILRTIYSAADVYVSTSRSESFGLTLAEAMSCGTSCVAFNIGGIPDIVDNTFNGILAEPFNTQEIAKGIETVLQHNVSLSSNARNKIERCFSATAVATRYYELYTELSFSNQS